MKKLILFFILIYNSIVLHAQQEADSVTVLIKNPTKYTVIVSFRDIEKEKTLEPCAKTILSPKEVVECTIPFLHSGDATKTFYVLTQPLERTDGRISLGRSGNIFTFNSGKKARFNVFTQMNYPHEDHGIEVDSYLSVGLYRVNTN